jgi:RNA polymerase sigma-70 factor (ECF subfamily)
MLRREDEFERVALPHAPGLLRFALRLTHNSSSAEDLVQDTLMLAWRGFSQLESEDRARAWLFRILINSFHGDYRKQQSAPPTLQLERATATGTPAFDSLEVVQAIDRLPPDQRTVLLLAAVEGFTCREMACILSVPIGTVMSRLSRAREAARALLAPIEKVAR